MKHTRTLNHLVEKQVHRARLTENSAPEVEGRAVSAITPMDEEPATKGSLHVFPITLAIIFFIGIPAVSIFHAPIAHTPVNTASTVVSAPTTTTMH